MIIEEIFEKKITREIPGVIKVSKNKPCSVYQELDEYVVTNELSKHFSEFFANYSKGIDEPTEEIGVWISGFFGSGKSHFLKILSYLLDSNLEVKCDEENKSSRRPIDFFKEDNKIKDPMVIADMEKATSVSTDVILFNIDLKASHDNLDNKKDDLVNIFFKVFNEMRGFCGGMPFLANLEKNLVSKNLYDNFKEEFKNINGKDWEKQREDYYFIQDEIVKTIVNINYMSEESANRWADKAEDNIDLSIENFAKEINEYCQSKGNNHHIVFLVDEIGQYIAEDTNLMLNLQTIVEELGTKCQGNAWVVVTSQQNIDDITKVKGNDFSKIQGRFKTRLSLSSSDVDEIIRRRLLEKNESAKQSLEAHYPQIEADIKNKLTFEDSAEMKKYSNEKDYARVYPFIPYQFSLMQLVLKYLREKGISGSGVGEGERSMLALFRDAAISVKNKPIGDLVPFNTFYEPIENFIEHTYRSVISNAQKNEALEPKDVEVLKVLFMIRHVKEIKPTLNNIATLMISNTNDNRTKLKDEIEESLNRLKKQFLIQKNGEEYIFLTNEEQDINREIKRELVEPGEVLDKVYDSIFLGIYSENKYRLNNRYNFSFNKSIDNKNKSSKHPIGMRIITPYFGYEIEDSTQTQFDNSDNESLVLKKLSDENKEVIVQLHSNLDVFDEIKEALQIIKYLTKNTKINQDIKNNKNKEYTDKLNRANLFLEDAVKNATVYVKGDKINIKEQNAKERLDKAMGKLIDKVYNKLNYMDFAPDKTDVIKALQEEHQNTLVTVEPKSPNALKDVFNYIDMQFNLHIDPKLKVIMDRFSGAPYGFVDLDIQWLIATLFAQKNINLTLNSEEITLKNTNSQKIFDYLTKREFSEKILISKRKEISVKKKDVVKEIMKEVFHKPFLSEDSEKLVDEFKRETSDKLDEVEKCLLEFNNFNHTYPGKQILEEAQKLFKTTISKKNINEFFDYVFENSEEFKQISKDLLSVTSFFNGTQKDIYVKSWQVYDTYESNKNLIQNNQLNDCADKIYKILKQPNPYSNIRYLNPIIDEFEGHFDEILEEKRKIVNNDIKQNWCSVVKAMDTDELKDKFYNKFELEFSNLNNKLNQEQNISIIVGISNEANNLREKCINEISELNGGTKSTEEFVTLDIKHILKSSIIMINDENEINQLLEQVKSKVKEELQNNKKVNLKL